MSAVSGEASRATNSWPRDGLPQGTLLYGFRITGFLGRGGFGITYRAVDRINQMFALKESFPRQFAVRDGLNVLPIDDGVAGEMFTRCLDCFTKEALALTRFSKIDAADDGVVKVITSFELNSTAYIVMEFVEGESLERLIKTAPSGIPEARLTPIIRNIATTLGRVHANGLLHRDIKPANLVLRKNDHPVLLDFGAARAVRPDGPIPSQIYTETYAPIEQMEGRAQGPFSDLYSLGVTCYQVIAGSRFHGAPTSDDRYRASLRRDPDPLVPAVQVGAGRYSQGLLQAIDLLLRVAPEDRPQTVDEFLRHWDRTADDEADETRMVTLASDATVMNARPAALLDPNSTVFERSRSGRGAPAGAKTLFAMTPVSGTGAAVAAHPAAKRSAAPLGAAGISLLLAAGCGYWYATRPKPADSVAPGLVDAVTLPPWSKPNLALAAPPVPAMQMANASLNPAAPVTPASASIIAPVAPQPISPPVPQIPVSPPKPIFVQPRMPDPAPKPQPASVPTASPPASGLSTSAPAVPQPSTPATAFVALPPTPMPNSAQRLADAKQAYEAKNYAAAFSGYQTAAEAGDSQAQYQIGFMYQMGQGVPTDTGMAMIWYRKSATQNDAEAQAQIGYLYLSGLGVLQDYALAAHWYNLAAAQGYKTAQLQMGYLSLHGFGMPQNYAAAFRWYQLAAGQNVPSAQSQLGFMYEKGLGVSMNYVEAMGHYRIAAEMGVPAAQYAVGRFYAEGLGTPRNLPAARDWMIRAKAGGNVQAGTWLVTH